ncbi:hypothetical protein CEF21_15035 [Bacillus sp. FJAT-42376]|uniref:hypothetical protein n=1 Tax=Bacillus sp. FJAT-42376 TaxID=2014076 RepID=UPI000F4F19ED|nr:hypothetical protein [Bacillus sp. FJAT-42376]AZB43510.1 hypothetical protein CEF21_15035 [Bacillus sp. FJAT-42376]
MSEVLIEYLNEEKSEWLYDYGAKRKVKYSAPVDGITADQYGLLNYAHEFTREEVSAKSLRSMDNVAILKLVERIAMLFCRVCAPMRDYGLEKSYIRHEILNQILQIREGEGHAE